MEAVIVVLGTVAAMLAWGTTVAWHVASRAEKRITILERVIDARGRAMRAVSDFFFTRTP